MGTREIRYCDITGTEPAEVHEINIDQMRVEVDLCPSEYKKLLGLLGPYIDAGRVEAAATVIARANARKRSTALNQEERARLKQWAAETDVYLPPNGRFKRVIVEQWREHEREQNGQGDHQPSLMDDEPTDD